MHRLQHKTGGVFKGLLHNLPWSLKSFSLKLFLQYRSTRTTWKHLKVPKMASQRILYDFKCSTIYDFRQGILALLSGVRPKCVFISLAIYRGSWWVSVEVLAAGRLHSSLPSLAR